MNFPENISAALGLQCSRLRRSQQALRACGRRCAPAAFSFFFFALRDPKNGKKNVFFFFFCCSPLRVIEHPRACGARPAMLAPSALAAGAARLRQALRACRICKNYYFGP